MKKLFKVVHVPSGKIVNILRGKKSEPAYFDDKSKAKEFRNKLNGEKDHHRIFRGPDHRLGETDDV